MLSRILLPSIARAQGQQSARILSQRLPQLSSAVRTGFGNKFDHSMIKLKQSQGQYVAMFSSHPIRQSADARAVMEDLTDSSVTTQHQDGQDPAAPAVAPLRFDQIEAINPMTQRSLEKIFKYKEMSVVQAAVLSRLPNEKDMFVKAKTGTGKTLAFLVAALETSLAGKSKQDLQHCDGTSILVISPTRELAYQIAEEAKKLTKFYPFDVHCLVGGDSKRRQIMQMERGRCDIVVATPGRLNDMLSSVRHLKRACENLKVLVLDEADQLLDMGFKQELQRILSHLPEKRQTMLYSATISQEIRKNLGNFALSPEHDIIDTVGKDEVNTHMHVKQSAMVAPYADQIQLLQNMLETHKAANSGKVIVFLPTTKQTMLYAQLFKYLLPKRVIHEIHSRKTQDQRSRIASRFRKSNDGILVTSDVSARGVDYPGVSLVVQIGVPSTREQYIHRLGRTGRAGREGEGVIVLAPFETEFLSNDIADLPVEKLEPTALDEEQVTINERAVNFAVQAMDDEMIREIYTGYLGYYAGRMPQLMKPRSLAIQTANQFMEGVGIKEVPHLSPRFKQQLGLNERTINRSERNTNDRYGDRRRPNDRFDGNRRGSFSRNDDGGFSNNRFGGDRGRSSFGGDRDRSSFGGGDRRRNNDSFGGGDRRRNNDSFGGDRRHNNDSFGGGERRRNSDRFGEKQERFGDKRERFGGEKQERFGDKQDKDRFERF